MALAGQGWIWSASASRQQTLGRRGQSGDPLYGIRRIARTRIQLLSARQYALLTGVFDIDEHPASKSPG